MEGKWSMYLCQPSRSVYPYGEFGIRNNQVCCNVYIEFSGYFDAPELGGGNNFHQSGLLLEL